MAFKDIFKDDNVINEKNVVGFLSFAIMAIFAIADIITGFIGKELLIQDFIYNSFVILFKNNEMVSLITTDGKRSSEHLMILSNNLVKIDKEDITDYDLIEVDITRNNKALDSEVVQVETDEGSLFPVGGIRMTIRCMYEYQSGTP